MDLRRLILPAAIAAALLFNPAATVHAQDSDIIRGRVTSNDSLPLEGARITVTSISGSVSRNARTDKNGRFTVIFPGGEGDYIVSVSVIGFVARNFQVKRLADEDILIADARLQRIAQELDAVVVNAGVRNPASRNDPGADVAGTEHQIDALLLPPDLQGDLAALAALLPGVLFMPGMDGGPDGFSVLGLDPSQNMYTLDGLPFDGADLPRDAGLITSLNTSPFDVSRGGFSGAQLSVRRAGGSNYRVRGMSLNVDMPQLQWSDQTGRALGREYTNLSLGGILSGPIKLNKSFYSVSYQASRRMDDLQTPFNTNPIGLRASGIANDSIARLQGILQGAGIPLTAGSAPTHRYNDRISTSGRFTVNPPNSTTGTSWSFGFNSSWNKTAPTSSSVTEFPSHAGERTSQQGGLQAGHTSYVKQVILSETSLGLNASSNSGNPYLTLPSGRVRINSSFEDGTNGVSSITFGGNQGLGSASKSGSVNFSNNLSWFSLNNKHRLKLTTELRYNTSSSEQASNYLGTFQFNSLEELENGTPSSFARQLTIRESSSSQTSASISLGDSWRKSDDVQFTYGIRVDGGRFSKRPEYNPEVEQLFGVRNDYVPTAIAVSPRIGFSWRLGTAAQVSGFEGAVRGPRSTIRGGIGIFQSNPSSGSINSAVNNTGLPSGVQQLSCVGAAAPIPDWELYMTDPSMVPFECADGTTATVFSSSSPNVTVISRDFTAPRSVRSNLSWSGAVLDGRFQLGVDGTHSLNLNQSSSVDLNFDPTVRFALDNEAGRPIFVRPTSIVPGSGSIASRDARIAPQFARVSESRSDMRSESWQLSLNLSPMRVSASSVRWRLSYVYADARQRERGFTGTTVGNPLDAEWGQGGNTTSHQVSYNLSYNLFGYATISWNHSFRSGRNYTPMISGDVNGDGYSNDRAFVFDPASAADPQVAEDMQQLLETTSSAARACLQRQLGQLAARNSCRGPWTTTASLNFQLDPIKFRMPRRAQIQFSLSNPLGAADLLFNGSANPKGWGESGGVEQTLLYIRGFDPVTQRYRYEVNERFGSDRQQFNTARTPVRVTMQMRFDLGPTRERQQLMQNLDRGRTTEGSRYPQTILRSQGTAAIPNAMSLILRQQDSLRLTAEQADSIATLNRYYTIQADSIWTVASKYLSELPDEYDDQAAYGEYLRARWATADLMIALAPKVKELLTASQLRKLPSVYNNYLDKRYLTAIRGGSMMYTR